MVSVHPLMALVAPYGAGPLAWVGYFLFVLYMILLSVTQLQRVNDGKMLNVRGNTIVYTVVCFVAIACYGADIALGDTMIQWGWVAYVLFIWLGSSALMRQVFKSYNRRAREFAAQRAQRPAYHPPYQGAIDPDVLRSRPLTLDPQAKRAVIGVAGIFLGGMLLALILHWPFFKYSTPPLILLLLSLLWLGYVYRSALQRLLGQRQQSHEPGDHSGLAAG